MLWPRTVRGLWGREPSAEVRGFQREMDRLFGGSAAGGARRVFPPVNVWRGRDDAVVTAELPGVDPKRVEIVVVGDTLTVRGSRDPEPSEKGRTHTRLERAAGTFSRAIQLPFRVQPDGVQATYAKGILRVVLPRLEAGKPKQIPIQSAD